MAGMWITRLGVKEQVKLRSDIWSSLPDDLLDIVISRLPLQSLVRMRSVCKKWKIKIRTPSFIRQCELDSTNGYNEWFLTFGQHKNAFAYDLHLSKWHSGISLGFLPLERFSPLAAADGLLCLRGSKPGTLVVCNPLSRFWRDVPLPARVDPSVMSLIVNRVSGSYKLVIVTQFAAIVFESQSLTWRSYELVERGASTVICSALCEGIFYCLTAHELLAFNVDWTNVRIALPAEVVSPRLVARSSQPGRLFLVGAYRHKSQSVRIWELDRETRRWSVVDILLEASRASKFSPDVIAYVKCSSRFLACDVSRKAWVWLPRAQGSLPPCQNGFFFTPSLLLP